MNKIFALIIVLTITTSKGYTEENGADQQQLTQAERQEIAWAISILEKYQAITINQNKCIEFKPGLIEMLKSEGLLKKDSAALMSVCVDSGN